MVVQQGRVQAEHSKILAEHSRTLAEYSATLAEHAATLEDHTRRLIRIEEELRTINPRLDQALGYLTVERYRNKAHAYLGAIARRIQQLKGHELDDVLEPMEDASLLDEHDRLELSETVAPDTA